MAFIKEKHYVFFEVEKNLKSYLIEFYACMDQLTANWSESFLNTVAQN